VIDVANDDLGVPPRDSVWTPWHGLPVFSAWMSEPAEAEPAA